MQELAARKVDMVKIWVDDRNGKYKKLTPELYGASSTKLTRHKLRVTAHIFALDDAKGLLEGRDRRIRSRRTRQRRRRGVRGAGQGAPEPRARPEPPRSRSAADLSWLKRNPSGRRAEEIAGAATRPARGAAGVRNPGAEPGQDQCRGRTVAFGTDGNAPWAPHVEMADMVAAGMTPMQVIEAATRNGRLPPHPRPRHRGGGQERRLHRARREPAGRHHQHPADFRGLPAGRRREALIAASLTRPLASRMPS